MSTLKLLAAVAGLSMAVGCADMQGVVDEVGQSSDAITNTNGLLANGLLANGLKLNGLKLNGLKLNGLKLNGLKLNGLKLNGLKLNGVDDYTSAKAIQYMTECAQAAGVANTVCDDVDTSYCRTFNGSFGMGTSEGLSTDAEQSISSCVIARFNDVGATHTIDLVGNGLAATGGSYQWEEARYWGNLYSESGATLSACMKHGSNLSDSSQHIYNGRICYLAGAGGNPFSGQQPSENDCGISNIQMCDTQITPPSYAESVFVTARLCGPVSCY